MFKNKLFRKLGALCFASIFACSLFVGCGSNKDKSENSANSSTSKETNEKYTDNNLLVSAKWLSDNLNKDNVLILDMRDEKSYNKSHIPGAINTKWQSFADVQGKPGDKNWGLVLDAKNLSKKLAEIGVDKDKTIVAYADNKSGWGEDGRMVWMLKMAGIKDAKMLNGGWQYWETNKLKSSADASKPKATNFSVDTLDKSMYADTEYVKANLNTAKILDSREDAEFKGAQKFGEARGGHIPNAKLFTFNKVFNEDGTVKSQKDIEAMLSSMGIKKEDQIITYCTAGIRSAHLALILKMCGYNNVKNYDGSYYAWSADKNLELQK